MTTPNTKVLSLLLGISTGLPWLFQLLPPSISPLALQQPMNWSLLQLQMTHSLAILTLISSLWLQPRHAPKLITIGFALGLGLILFGKAPLLYWPAEIFLGYLGWLTLSPKKKSESFKNDGKKSLEKRDSNSRIKISTALLIKTENQQKLSILSFDISENGVFIPQQDLNQGMNLTGFTGKRNGLKVGDRLEIQFLSPPFRKVKCEGRIVRNETTAKGNYPAGFAIQFQWKSKREKRKLLSLLENQQHILSPSIKISS